MRQTEATAAVAIIALLFAAPLLLLVMIAFGGPWRFPALMPAGLSLRAWHYLLDNAQRIGGALTSSILYSLSTAAICGVLCLAPARTFARDEFRGRIVLETILLAPALLPPIVFVVGLQIVFIRIGLIDNHAGVIVVLTMYSYPYMLRALIAGYRTIPADLTNAATNLGASRRRAILGVELPLLGPALVAGGFIVFLVAFSEYFLVFTVGGGRVASFTAMFVPFLSGADRAIASAMALIFVTIPLSLFVLVDLLVRRAYRRRGM